MRQLFKFTFAANIILTIVSYFFLPAKVAMHFGAGGYPDSWCLKHTYILSFFAIDVPLFLLIYFMPLLIVKCPANLLNLPNKTFWLKQENHPRLKEKTNSVMSEFGAALFIFFFMAELLTFEANRSDPIRFNEHVFLSALILFLIYTVYWCVKLFRTFRIPENSSIS